MTASYEHLRCIHETLALDDPSPEEVRTKSALEATTSHLYSLLGGRADYPEGSNEIPLLARSNFLWDRLRVGGAGESLY